MPSSRAEAIARLLLDCSGDGVAGAARAPRRRRSRRRAARDSAGACAASRRSTVRVNPQLAGRWPRNLHALDADLAARVRLIADRRAWRPAMCASPGKTAPPPATRRRCGAQSQSVAGAAGLLPRRHATAKEHERCPNDMELDRTRRAPRPARRRPARRARAGGGLRHPRHRQRGAGQGHDAGQPVAEARPRRGGRAGPQTGRGDRHLRQQPPGRARRGGDGGRQPAGRDDDGNRQGGPHAACTVERRHGGSGSAHVPG